MGVIRKILVVDDDEATRFLCREALGLEGYVVENASNGAEALENMKNSRYDLVISDMEMPGLDGINLYMSASREYPHLKERFVFMTGNAGSDKFSELKKMERRYIIKPFKITDLLGVVEKLISLPVNDAVTKRNDERYLCEFECSLFDGMASGHRFLNGKTHDLSRNGAKIKYGGELLVPHTAINFFVEINNISLNRQAQVVWSRFLGGDEAAAGIRFSEPIPSSILSSCPEFKSAHA